MQKNAPIKLILAGLLLLAGLWWLWSTSDQGTVSSDGSAAVSQQEFVSAIKPVDQADATPEEIPEKTPGKAMASTWTLTPLVKAEAGAEVVDSFDKASQSFSQGDRQRAITELENLIGKYPSQVEPYINLASIHASDGKLELARQTLMQGLNANENYATLFTNLQKIHGALAANAYQTALAEQGEAISKVELPLISTIDLTTVNQDALATAESQLKDYQQRLQQSNDEVVRLEKQIAQSDQELALLGGKLTESQQQLQLSLASTESQQSKSMDQAIALQNQLDQAQARIANLQRDHKVELKGLQDELQVIMASADSKAQQTLAEQASITRLKEQLDQAQKQIVSLRSDQQSELEELQQEQQRSLASAETKASGLAAENAALQSRLQTVQQQLAGMQSDHQLEVAILQERLRQQLDTQNTVAANQQTIVAQPSQSETREPAKSVSVAALQNTDQLSQSDQERAAIALVESWASAWSDQNVDRYLAHYLDGYAPPGSGLSNAAWVEQRRIRLTNKEFIQVAVSNFNVQILESTAGEERFAVTFLQHYRADRLDDKIRKRLLFSSNESDWSQARIIGEQVIR